MTLKLGIPSKGRLMDKTVDWFAERGVTIRRLGDDRDYAGAVDGAPGIDLVLLSAGEIPRELAAGRIHLGVEAQVREGCDEVGFRRCVNVRVGADHPGEHGRAGPGRADQE